MQVADRCVNWTISFPVTRIKPYTATGFISFVYKKYVGCCSRWEIIAVSCAQLQWMPQVLKHCMQEICGMLQDRYDHSVLFSMTKVMLTETRPHTHMHTLKHTYRYVCMNLSCTQTPPPPNSLTQINTILSLIISEQKWSLSLWCFFCFVLFKVICSWHIIPSCVSKMNQVLLH